MGIRILNSGKKKGKKKEGRSIGIQFGFGLYMSWRIGA